jgi:uncharacterized membrane protein YfcA
MQLYLPIAEISLSLPMLVCLGLAVGMLSGLLGVGGGFILTPLLIFLGIPPMIAVGTGASQVVASSVSGAVGHWQRGNVDFLMGLLLIIGGMAGALSGVKLQQILREAGQLDLFTTLTYVIMLGVVGALMLIESVGAMRKSSSQPGGGSARRAGQHSWVQKLPFKRRFHASKLYISMLPPLAIGLFVGWLTAIMGIGGGFLIVPALIYILRMPTRIALGTSGFQIIFVTAFATILQATENHAVDLVLAMPLIIGGVVGAQFGVGLAHKLKAEELRALLALLVLAVAIRMAFGLVIAPREVFGLDLSS